MTFSPTAPRGPRPGDVIILGPECSYFGVKPGSRAVIDSSRFGLTSCMVVFSASAHRDDRPQFIDPEIGEPHVSLSGGPCPFVDFADLAFAGETEQTFWRWKNGIVRAHNGEDYTRTVLAWTWTVPQRERAERAESVS